MYDRGSRPLYQGPRYLIRDSDGIYGHEVPRCLKALGIEEVKTSRGSPWQNPFVERLVGTLRRECRDYVIVLNERHLRRILASLMDYYHTSRRHQSLEDNSTLSREVEPLDKGPVVSTSIVGGLHHRYLHAS